MSMPRHSIDNLAAIQEVIDKARNKTPDFVRGVILSADDLTRINCFLRNIGDALHHADMLEQLVETTDRESSRPVGH